MVEICLQAEGLPEKGSVFRRRAARGIVVKEGELLLIHTGAGDYKFPGGGVESGETLEQAHIRAIYVEDAAKIYSLARSNGDVKEVPEEFVEIMKNRRKGR